MELFLPDFHSKSMEDYMLEWESCAYAFPWLELLCTPKRRMTLPLPNPLRLTTSTVCTLFLFLLNQKAGPFMDGKYILIQQKSNVILRFLHNFFNKVCVFFLT